MQELAIGSQLPFLSHREVLLHAQLDAMPPIRSFGDRIEEISVFASVLFPEFGKIRGLARVNGFYLQTLLSEGKRKEAEPFIHTGELLVVQLANDQHPSLIGLLVTQAVGSISERYDARVCRSFGLNDEAAMIEAHQKILLGKMREWKENRHNELGRKNNELVTKHGGMMAAILLPVFGAEPGGVISQESLSPSCLLYTSPSPRDS